MESKLYSLRSSKGETLCRKMVIEKNLFMRMKGLMFSEGLPDCDGFLISPCNSIHTFFMRYPLDVIFLDGQFQIVKVIYGLSPWRITGVYFKAAHVLEMRAGTLAEGLTKGEKLEVVCIN